MICHCLNMHHRAKHVYLVGPTRYGGMEVATFAVYTDTHRWETLLDHLERNDSTKMLFWASLVCAQLAVDSDTELLSLPYTGYVHLVQDFWIKQLWKFLDKCKAKVNIPGLWIPQLQMER